ncbi:Activator of Hsp90 ATPase [Spironucleus salmonicida]|uniref:Activator of Hsp90 ATPase n=1 Tax=Spironucleus salmonicida TaxID=348837 RepID=V6LXA7_9EUKA|nr:Activator of Hsp90 ATPase [Spironucleus salmonicida]|eukprot:EST49262.1 Activator of Hsp90 ATPase, N-terminal domain-containing protein [Spironucleus salmonicida]
MSKTPAHHNIGNWHWDEKSFTEWSKTYIKELFEFVKDVEEGIKLEITVDEVKGEAFKIVRKNKLRSSFDFKIKMKFSYLVAEKDTIKGTILFEPFCDETDPEDWCYEVKIENVKEHNADNVADCKALVCQKLFIDKFQTYADEFNNKMD